MVSSARLPWHFGLEKPLAPSDLAYVIYVLFFAPISIQSEDTAANPS